MIVETIKIIGIIEMVILIIAELAVITPIIIDMWRDERKKEDSRKTEKQKDGGITWRFMRLTLTGH